MGNSGGLDDTSISLYLLSPSGEHKSHYFCCPIGEKFYKFRVSDTWKDGVALGMCPFFLPDIPTLTRRPFW